MAEAPPREFASSESEVSRLIKDLEHQISHLVRSNAELEEFMKENGEQKELRTAIGENIVTIARRRAVLEDLMRQAGIAPARASAMQSADGDAANPAATTSAAAAAEPSGAQPMDTSEGTDGDGNGVYL